MKKNLFFWILALVICSVISCAEKEHFEQELQTQEREQFKEDLSHEVTQAEARQNLEKIIFDLKIPSTRGGNANNMPPITSVYTRGKAAIATRAGEEIEPYFHIFNFGNEEGFAIMSGDDRVEPLLALTFKGELTPETEIDNPGFEIAYSRMEEYYVQKVSQISLNGGGILPPTIDPIPYPTYDTTVICSPAMCPVKWHQKNPYNQYCYTQDNQQATVGCAAVAIAQLMAIHKYPNYYIYLFSSETETFDWDEMTRYPETAAGIEQIDSLMYLLGKPNNLCMTYRTEDAGGSGSNPANVPRTLRNFGYSDSFRCIDYDTDSVMMELMDGYPVLLRGKTVENKGHMWLGHGSMKIIITPVYPDTYPGIIQQQPMIPNYIVCSWGRENGESDGYYLSGVFNTDPGPRYPDENITRLYFQNDVEAYINIRKPY